MSRLIDRSYCLKHPAEVVRFFGLAASLGTLVSDKKSLLERVVDHYEAHGFAFPGDVGRAYRLAALIEYRVAQIYGRLAERFAAQPEVAAFFRDLQEEEREHGEVMQLCRFGVVLHPRLQFIPSIRDPEIRAILTRLRELRGRIDTISLEEALATTVALEQSEVNSIFDRLLKQVDAGEVRLFQGRLSEVEGHAESVPRRVVALRQRLGLE